MNIIDARFEARIGLPAVFPSDGFPASV